MNEFLENSINILDDNNGAISLDISASEINHFDNGLSDGGASSSGVGGPKSKYSELLQRKNMRNQ